MRAKISFPPSYWQKKKKKSSALTQESTHVLEYYSLLKKKSSSKQAELNLLKQVGNRPAKDVLMRQEKDQIETGSVDEK